MRKAVKSLLVLGLCSALHLRADHYVAQNGQEPEWPYATLNTAASNIQDAVNAATNGALVWVHAGEYYTPTNAVFADNGTSVVCISNAITLRSVNGAASTIIDGGGSNRCVYINVSAANCAFGPAILDGFTLTNGYSILRGAGVVIAGGAAGTGVVQNCVVSGNAVGKAIENAWAGGGGIYAYNSLGFIPVVSNCLVRGNRVFNVSVVTNGLGGGIFLRVLGQVVDCTITENSSDGYGGGFYLNSPRSLLDRCLIVSNTAASGGGLYARSTSMELRNCQIANNSAASGSGLFFYSFTNVPIYNCTFVNNTFQIGNQVANGDLRNNIIQSLIINADATITGYNNCLPSIPVVGEWNNTIVTTNNLDYVGFVNLAAGNYRLTPESPCVNVGNDQLEWLKDSRDLDRHQRIDRFYGLPDIGCYEYLPGGTVFGLR